jgi:hypothetical protein
MDNTDWTAAAAKVDDLELDRGYDAEYQGKFPTFQSLVLVLSLSCYRCRVW